MLTPESRREQFPTLDQMVYLNSAAEGIPPLAVQQGLNEYFADKLLGMDGRDPHFAALAETRALVADFYGLTTDEISICSCSSEAYNLAALALHLKPGDEVVINELDFPAGITPFLPPNSPATVRVWRARDGRLDLADLPGLLSSQTRFINLSLVSFFNGFRLPLQETIAIIRKHSPALIAVDVTQALGRIEFDLRDVDLIVSSTHKWILASHGGGLVGVPMEKAAAWHVPAGGWYNLEDAFGTARFEAAVSKPGAAGFAVGMPNFPAIYAIRSALRYIQSVGVAKINAAAQPLVEHCLKEVSRLPVDLLTPTDLSAVAGIIAFRHPAADQIARQLRSQQIHIMSHAGRLRVAIHGYNTASDIEKFLSALSQALKSVG